MTCHPFCDLCGGNLGHAANNDWTCARCKLDALRKCRKERIRKDEFESGNPIHFRLQSRGGAWRYYRRVDAPVISGLQFPEPGESIAVDIQQEGRLHRPGRKSIVRTLTLKGNGHA